MNIEVTENTAVFCRGGTGAQEYIQPHEFKGFGHEFEKAYIINQVDGSTGHHRIISYRFGGLSFIVRHETDGYVTTETKTSSSKAKDNIQNDLSNMLGALSLSPASSITGIIPKGSKLTIKERGYNIPLESTLEIKTRVFHKPLQIDELASQLWVSQTPKLVRAYHEKGIFRRPVVEDVTTVIKTWEERKQSDLRTLAALIREIINLAKVYEGNAILKYNVEGDKLVVCKVGRREMLPKDLYSKWDGGHYLKEGKDTQNAGAQGPAIPKTEQESKSASNITSDDFKTTIKIGDKDYSASVFKIPYLASYVRRQKPAQPEATQFVHEPIMLFDVAVKGVESGYRHCFRSLPTSLSQHRTLFETYKFLDVDVLGGLSSEPLQISSINGIVKSN